ncbi:MAG: PAS domain S-box protein [Pirellulales bacterium]|nr:PAS domain S-box protein [Pirellulales bacterium]
MSESHPTCDDVHEELARAKQRVAELEANERHRARMQTELQKSEAQYRQLVEGVNSVILRMDTEGNVTFANRFTYAFFGYSEEELLGKHVVGTIVPETDSAGQDLARMIREVCQDPEHFQHNENENLCRDGSRVWVSWTNKPVRDENGELIEILCIGNDITHRKRFEEALAASEENYRTVFTETTDAVALLDADAARFVDANPATLGIFGYTRDELLGKSFEELSFGKPPYSQRDAEVLVRSAQEQGRVLFEWCARRKDGQSFWASGVLKRIRIGQNDRILCIARDITEQKEQEQRERQEQENLRQLLESQERERRLIAYEIHDGLAQLLTGATMQLEVFRALHDKKPGEAWKALDDGQQALTRGLAETRRLIRGLRSPILDESGVVAAVEQLIVESHEQPGPTVEFVHDVQFDRLDPALENALFRIVQESLTNARRYSGSDRVRVALTQEGNQARLEIQDWGVGFTPEQVAPERFGLQGIRQRARLFGGDATIESQPGQGTRVLVELPLEERAANDF